MATNPSAGKMVDHSVSGTMINSPLVIFGVKTLPPASTKSESAPIIVAASSKSKRARQFAINRHCRQKKERVIFRWSVGSRSIPLISNVDLEELDAMPPGLHSSDHCEGFRVAEQTGLHAIRPFGEMGTLVVVLDSRRSLPYRPGGWLIADQLLIACLIFFIVGAQGSFVVFVLL